MFRDEAQTHAALRVLLGTAHKDVDRWWTATGPTEEAVRVVEERSGPMSAGEVLLVLVAFDLWNGRGAASLGRVFSTLDEPLAALGSLLVAVSEPDPATVDRWILQQKGRGSVPR